MACIQLGGVSSKTFVSCPYKYEKNNDSLFIFSFFSIFTQLST